MSDRIPSPLAVAMPYARQCVDDAREWWRDLWDFEVRVPTRRDSERARFFRAANRTLLRIFAQADALPVSQAVSFFDAREGHVRWGAKFGEPRDV